MKQMPDMILAQSSISPRLAVQRIENFMRRQKNKKRSKDLLEKLKAMPGAVRLGFVKMQVTKWEQEELKHKFN